MAVFKLKEPTQHTMNLGREVARNDYRGGVRTAEVYEGGSYHRF
jgi:hypothetical protein